jgi:cytosine/adenosine deaminase-related metal-dependent hydrolase
VSTLLIKNIHTLVTMNEHREELRRAALFVRDGVIERVGATETLPPTADEVLDLQDRHVVVPGFVNTHHHFYQTLTRVIPAAQNSDLFGWLQALYPIWANLTPEGVHVSAQLCAAELMLSGCTTASDHLYLFPNGVTLDDEIHAVSELGLRFHACRGSMSVGESLGGLPPDSLVENEQDVLRDSLRVIEKFHDGARHSMLRIALAPCSPFSVSRDLMRETAKLARSYPGVRLHTHLAESKTDVEYSLSKFGLSPGDYAESVEWLGEDVWHAHCVWLSDASIAKFARSRTGVAHCPCSNMRLASGIAPIRKMRNAGVSVGLGADGAASNDATNLLHEARQALLSARIRDCEPGAMTAREALELATRGGAAVLGRDDIGYIAPGMSADFIAMNLDQPTLAGAQCDPVAALVMCEVNRVDYSYIDGHRVVDAGRLTTTELPALIERINKLSAMMLREK